jgi:hypothetical protein
LEVRRVFTVGTVAFKLAAFDTRAVSNAVEPLTVVLKIVSSSLCTVLARLAASVVPACEIWAARLRLAREQAAAGEP